jgi:hypothetical protein
MKVTIKEIQKKIDDIHYWDVEILDFEAKYFGDEINLYIYGDEETSWKVSFLICDKVSYETDASWKILSGKTYEVSYRTNHVKDLALSQLGYYGQDITLSQEGDFIGVKMDLSIMYVKLQCKNIKVEKVNNSEIEFFWNKR